MVLIQGAEFFVATENLGFRIPDNNHNWIKRSPGEASETVSLGTPAEYAKNEVHPIYGISGFEMWDTANIRYGIECNYESC